MYDESTLIRHKLWREKHIKKKYKNITSVVKYKRRKNDKIRIKNHKMAFHTKYEQIMKNG